MELGKPVRTKSGVYCASLGNGRQGCGQSENSGDRAEDYTTISARGRSVSPSSAPAAAGEGLVQAELPPNQKAGQRALTPVSPRALHHHRIAQRLGFIDHLRKVFMSTCQEKQKSGEVRVMVGGLCGNSLEASRLSD